MVKPWGHSYDDNDVDGHANGGNGSTPHSPVALWKAVLAAVLAALVTGLGTTVTLLSIAASRQDVSALRAELLAHDSEQTAAIADLNLRLTRLEQELIDLLRSHHAIR